MRRTLPKLLSAFVVALTVACAGVALVVARADGGSIGIEEVLSIVGGLATAVVGTLIVWSRRGGAIGGSLRSSASSWSSTCRLPTRTASS